MKILLPDWATVVSDGDLSLAPFEAFGEVTAYEFLSREALLRSVADYDVILCNKTEIDRELMDAAPRLRYIGLFATGYNNIDIAAAREKGITVCNAGSYSTSAVAQQTFAYILSHFSAVERYRELVTAGGWINSPTFSMLCVPTDEIAGKTIGIIGYGSIGKRVAEIARAFEMRVLVYTRTVRDDAGVSFVSLDKLLHESDIVTVHCPLNEQSREMFNAETFAKMKDGAFFINTARGGVISETALRNALCSGKLSGAAVDVLQHEPMLADCPLRDAPNLIITPHTSWAPLTTRQRLVSIVTGNLTAFLNGKPTNVVS